MPSSYTSTALLPLVQAFNMMYDSRSTLFVHLKYSIELGRHPRNIKKWLTRVHSLQHRTFVINYLDCWARPPEETASDENGCAGKLFSTVRYRHKLIAREWGVLLRLRAMPLRLVVWLKGDKGAEHRPFSLLTFLYLC